MPNLSIIIPSYKDPLLQKTINDLREKSVTNPEIIVVFDGHEQDITGADIVLSNGTNLGLRHTVNYGMSKASGDYLMKTDEHCVFGERFDEIMLRDIQDDWILIPRRYKLDTKKWEVMEGGPIDCERLLIDRPGKIGGVHWTSRGEMRKHILIDETMVFQGSCYMMSRKHWEWLGGLQEEGYGPFAQEAIELSLKTWLGGGKVMVDKNTWYAHKHRKFGRAGPPDGRLIRKGNMFSRDYWLGNLWEERVHDIEWLMERFGL